MLVALFLHFYSYSLEGLQYGLKPALGRGGGAVRFGERAEGGWGGGGGAVRHDFGGLAAEWLHFMRFEVCRVFWIKVGG